MRQEATKFKFVIVCDFTLSTTLHILNQYFDFNPSIFVIEHEESRNLDESAGQDGLQHGPRPEATSNGDGVVS